MHRRRKYRSPCLRERPLIWGDESPYLGRQAPLFGETNHLIWGDKPPYLGRRITLFGETILRLNVEDRRYRTLYFFTLFYCINNNKKPVAVVGLAN
jgi:hypothetical protein